MPYTNTWVDNIPLGSALANTIDDQIRQLRLDIHERMDSVVIDWTADPVQLQSDVAIATTQKNIFVHHSAFQLQLPVSGFPASQVFAPLRTAESLSMGFAIGANLVSLWAPVILPVGAIITGVLFDLTQGSGVALNMKLRKFVFTDTPPVSSDLFALVSNNVAYKEYIVNGSYTILNNDVLFFEVQMSSTSLFYSAAVTYTVNNISQNI